MFLVPYTTIYIHVFLVPSLCCCVPSLSKWERDNALPTSTIVPTNLVTMISVLLCDMTVSASILLATVPTTFLPILSYSQIVHFAMFGS